MIAMTPIPPTISAIDEIDHQRQECGLADLLPDVERGILSDHVEVVGLIQRQTVADAHDLFDLREQRRPGGATPRRHGDQHALVSRVAAGRRPGCRIASVRRFRNDDEVVLPEVEAACRGRLPRTPMTMYSTAPTRTSLPIGSRPHCRRAPDTASGRARRRCAGESPRLR